MNAASGPGRLLPGEFPSWWANRRAHRAGMRALASWKRQYLYELNLGEHDVPGERLLKAVK
jgi:hypothetical protein